MLTQAAVAGSLCWATLHHDASRSLILALSVLLGVALDAPRYYLLATILTTAVGFGASVLAVQQIDEFLYDLGQLNRD